MCKIKKELKVKYPHRHIHITCFEIPRILRVSGLGEDEANGIYTISAFKDKLIITSDSWVKMNPNNGN